MFAYETFAIVLFVWSMVALVHLQMSGTTAWARTAWLIIGILISFVLAGTHHLSSYANLIVLGSFVAAAATLTVMRKEISLNLWEGLVFFTVAAIFVVWWFVNQAPNTKDYLLPYVEGGIHGDGGLPGRQRSWWRGRRSPA